MEEAELVIVFLPQNKTEIQKFFHHFSSLIPKTIFVIEKALNTKEDYHYLLKSKYGINSENIKIIPKCNEFTEACEDGRLLVFLEEKRKEGAKGQKNNYIFSLRKLAKCIFERSKSELVREVVSE